MTGNPFEKAYTLQFSNWWLNIKPPSMARSAPWTLNGIPTTEQPTLDTIASNCNEYYSRSYPTYSYSINVDPRLFSSSSANQGNLDFHPDYQYHVANDLPLYTSDIHSAILKCFKNEKARLDAGLKDGSECYEPQRGGIDLPGYFKALAMYLF